MICTILVLRTTNLTELATVLPDVKINSFLEKCRKNWCVVYDAMKYQK